MLDRDTIMMIDRKHHIHGQDRSDFQECLERVKNLSESNETIRNNEEFLEAIDRYLQDD